MESPFTNIERHYPNETARRFLGAYYTPSSAADYMANWIIRNESEHILEPSFGDGIFLHSLLAIASQKNIRQLDISGFEIDEAPIKVVKNDSTISNINVNCEDFLKATPFKVQAVIGNPPYVRLRHLTSEQRAQAFWVAQKVMGQDMDPSGSVWMPFILQSMRFLKVGGRLALVLPYDFTYVRYARPLWGTLQKNFGSLKVLRTHERLFPNILQDVVILFADQFGSETRNVHYQAFERLDDLLNDAPIVDEHLPIEGLLQGERLFLSALLGSDLRTLLQTQVMELTTPAKNLITFNIGYVAGDKEFFHPNEDKIREFHLPPEILRPTLTSTRMLKGAGLMSSTIKISNETRLFYPNPKQLTEGEKRYLAVGEASGVSNRYKCRVRNPWFIVPDTRIPDIVLSVFSERPVLLINDGDFLASNSLLCGFTCGGTKEHIATGWYTSLTLLQCEIEVHALGGGVMVMVPREAGSIRLPKKVVIATKHLETLDQHLRRGEIMEAYFAGDNEILLKQFGFSRSDVHLIHQGIETLTHWRTSARLSNNEPLLENVPKE